MTFLEKKILLGVAVASLTVLPAGEAWARKNQKKTEEAPPAPVPEMRIDPNLIKSYQDGANVESEREKKSGVQILAIEPAMDFHQFRSFQVRNDYFEIPLGGGASSSMAPSVWVGNPTGAVWLGLIRVRLGADFSYLGYDGAQTVRPKTLNLDFRDNISAHVLPIIASVRLGSASSSDYTLGLSPWFSAGSGMMLTQVSGNLDGTSQSGWSPVSKMSGGVRYALGGQSSLLGGLSVGVFRMSGSSKKAEWQGSGVTCGADVFL